jgi:hypothetical protein
MTRARCISLTTAAVGEVVFDGVSDLCGFCEASAMSAHPCVARIVRRIGADRVVLGPVGDVWSLLRSLSVDFVHAPGNRTVDEIHAEARRRGEPLAGSEQAKMPLQFDAFAWNWDSKTRGVLERDHPIPEWSSKYGIETVCAECYAALTLGVEFTLRMSLNGWSVPTVDVLKFVPFGELSLASVMTTSLPLSRELTLSTDLFKSAILPRPLVIPLGLLAITIRPELMLKLEMTAAISNPISLTIGAKQVSNVRLGVQLVAGKPLEYIRGADQTNSLVSSFSGLTPDAFTMQAIAGVRAELAFGIGLTLAALALLAPPKPIVTVSLFVKPQVLLGVVPSTVEQMCTLPWGYAAQVGLQVGAEVSPITIDLGLRSFELTFGGSLPYTAEFSAIEMQPPSGCSACTGCLGAIDQLARAVVALRGPTVMPSPLPTLNNPDDDFIVTIEGGATSLAIGAPLTILFSYPVGGSIVATASVSLAVEVRQAIDTTVLQTVVSSSEQLALSVPFTAKAVRLSALRPFTTLPLTSGVSKVRFVVIADHSDDVYGKSVWLDVRAPVAAGSALPTRVVGGWSACSVQCGSGGMQSRPQTCMTGDGARTTACSGAQPDTLPLQRACSALLASCPFVPYSVIEPVPQKIFASLSDWTSQRTSVVLSVEFGGGEIGRPTRISACYADYVSPCSTQRPKCMNLDEIMPNTRGSTRVQVELTPMLLLTLAMPRPVSLTLLFENIGGGANDWALSPAFVVRSPDMTYALDGDVTFVGGAVSVGGVFGAAVLLPALRYRRSIPDIGYPSRIAFTVIRDGRFSLSLRVESPGIGIPFTYIIGDYRKNKVAGSLVAFCEPLIQCRICDPDDQWCLTRNVADGFRQKLPPVCPGRIVTANASAPGVVASMQQCGTSGLAGVCQDSRSVVCPSPRRYVRNKCANSPVYIKCCPTLSQMSLLEADGGVEWDDGDGNGSDIDSNSNNINVGAIVGGVVGGVVLLLCVIAIVVFVVMRRRRVVFDLGDAAMK